MRLILTNAAYAKLVLSPHSVIGRYDCPDTGLNIVLIERKVWEDFVARRRAGETDSIMVARICEEDTVTCQQT